jgi:hypothetical protein
MVPATWEAKARSSVDSGVPDQLGQQDHTSRPAHKYKKRKIIREKLSRFCLSLAIKLRRLSKHKFKVNMPDY